MFFTERRTISATALLCLLAAMPAAQARQIRITAPAADQASASSSTDDATSADTLPPLTAEESEILGRALSASPTDLASTAAAPALRLPGAQKQQALSVNRRDNADGSSSITVMQSLQDSTIDAKVGADINTAAPLSTSALPATSPVVMTESGGSGAAWASIGLTDVASVNARLDPINEQGKFGTSIQHAIPIGKSLSVSLQGNYAVTQGLNRPVSTASSISGLPLMTAPAPDAVEQASAPPSPVWGSDNSLDVKILGTGTRLTADIATASNDPVTHNRISADQTLVGPLHVTTAVSDIGQPVTNKSITAGFDWNW